MVFGPKSKTPRPDINISIEGTKLEEVYSTKFLGVTIDSGLTWKPHIHQLTNKVAKSIGIISLARKTLNQNTCIQLYYSFVFPYLTYCTPIWGNTASSSLWPIYRLQKIAIRIVGGIRKGSSSKPFCKKFCILHLPEIYKLSLSIFMYKFHNALLPTTFNNLFTQNCNYHNHNTRSANLLRPPRTRIKLAENFVTNQGAKLWNEVSTKFNVNSSLAVFKTNIKKYLISGY
jgi:hypothetical protein